MTATLVAVSIAFTVWITSTLQADFSDSKNFFPLVIRVLYDIVYFACISQVVWSGAQVSTYLRENLAASVPLFKEPIATLVLTNRIESQARISGFRLLGLVLTKEKLLQGMRLAGLAVVLAGEVIYNEYTSSKA